MAIAFTRVKIYSRKQHRNAVDAAAYRSASRLEDKRTGQIFDYTKKQNVAYSHLMLPEGAANKFQDRELLWNAVEEVEKRKDAQLCKDVILALPKELELKDNIELAQRFAHEHFVSKGLPVDVSIHQEEGNPHAHLLVPMRRLEGEQFAKHKARDLNPGFVRGSVVDKDVWNDKWRDFQNQYFIEKGIDLVVDPDLLIPQVHHGHRRDNEMSFLKETNLLRAEAAEQIVLTNPNEVLHSLNKDFPVFSERELTTLLSKTMSSQSNFQQALSQVKMQPELVFLGIGKGEREHYTTEIVLNHDLQQRAHNHLLLPTGAHTKFQNRETLWLALEEAGSFQSESLCKDVTLNLPKELNLYQHIELASRFAEDHFVSRGLVADVTIHQGDDPYAHIVVPMRRLVGEQFLKEKTEGILKDEVITNQWQISRRSYLKRIFLQADREPFRNTSQQPSSRSEDIPYQKESKLLQKTNETIELTDPRQILNSISKEVTAFSEEQLARVLNKYVHPNDFQRVLIQTKSHPDLIHLGLGEDGREYYISKANFESEMRLEKNAKRLAKRQGHVISKRSVEAVITKYLAQEKLNAEQADAVRYVTSGGDIRLMVGRAGTGKTHTMKLVNEIYQQAGNRVLGVSLSGIAAEGLQTGAGIPSYTLESFKYRLDEKRLTLSANDIVVMDETSMTGLSEANDILEKIKQSGAKLIAIGDPEQAQSIGPGAFRTLLETLGFVELKEIIRQKEAWAREATALCAAGKTKLALDTYKEKGFIRLRETVEETQTALIDQWFADLAKTKLSESILMAHRNDDVNALNLLARQKLITENKLRGESHVVNAEKGKLNVCVGERILFLQNSGQLNVKNGQFGTVTDIHGEVLVVAVDGKGTIEVNTKHYNKLAYGYAATVHKLQGVTKDFAYIFAGGYGWSRNLIYVALSRHRQQCILYADKETHKNYAKLRQNLSHYGIKDALIDFPMRVAIRHGLEPEKLLDKVVTHLNKAAESIPDKWQWLLNYQGIKARKVREEKNSYLQETQVRRERAKQVAEYVALDKKISRAWAEHLNQAPKEEQSNISHADVKTLQQREINELIIKRNAMASHIYTNIAHYEIALDRHNLDVAMLMPHVKAHQCYQTVEAYLQEVKKGRTIHQQKLADKIQQDKKNHYFAIYHLLGKEKGQKTSYAIWQQSVAHRRRLLKMSLSPIERIGLTSVEAYRDISHTLGKLHANRKETRIGVLSDEQKHLLSERQRLARLIIKDFASHQKALQFYYADKHHYAKTLTNLEKAAFREVCRERVQAYLQAKEANHLILQQRLAYLITRNGKAHGMAMAELQCDWQAIWKDTWAYESRHHKKLLSRVEQHKLEKISQYQRLNRETGRLWSRLKTNNPKNIDTLSNKKQRQFQHAKAILNQRNQAAHRIEKNQAGYASLLEKRKINLEKLTFQAIAHERSEKIIFYKNLPDSQFKEHLAHTFKNEIKSYYGLLLEHGIPLDSFYHAAHQHERRLIVDSLPLAEGETYLALDNYVQQARHAGKAWQVVFKNNLQNDNTHEAVVTAKALSVARDELADKALVLLQERDNDNILSHFKIDRNKLEETAVKHQYRQKVQTYIQAEGEIRTILAREIISDKQRFKPYLYELNINRRVLQSDAALNQEHQNSSVYHGKASNNNVDAYAIQKPRWDKKVVEAALLASSEEFYASTLGEPTQRTGSTWRYGKKGSFVVNLHGIREGLWYSHESGEGGGPLQLLMNATHGRGLTFQDALEEGARFAGLTAANANAIIYKPKKSIQPEKNLHEQQYDEQRRIRKAQYLASLGKPIQGTLGEKYLRKHRGIQCDLAQSGFKFIPASDKYKHPAVMVIARNTNEKITAIQMIALDPKTGSKAKDVNVVKRTHGLIKGSAALIHSGSSHQVIIAEGPETAASLIQAAPKANIYVSLGNAANMMHMAEIIRKHNTNEVLIAADNDGANAPSEKALNKAIESLSKQGIIVKVARPELLPGMAKTDFNDVLKEKGIHEIKAILDKAKQIEHNKQTFEFSHTVLNLAKAQDVKMNINVSSQTIKTVTEKSQEKSLEFEINKTWLTLYKKLEKAKTLGHIPTILEVKNEIRTFATKLSKDSKLIQRLQKNSPKLAKAIMHYTNEKQISREYERE